MDEFIQGLEQMDPAALTAGALFIGGMAVVYSIFAIAWYFISAIGYRKMFIKAGQAGWKAFIPFYNDYIRFKISWKAAPFWIYLVVLIVFFALENTQNLALSLIAAVCGIVMIIMLIKMCIRLAKAFGKGAGCGILLFLFPFIVSLVLGFGKAEYIGNANAEKVPAAAENGN